MRKMKLLVSLFLCLGTVPIFSQQSLDSAAFAAHSYSFTIDNKGGLQGEGANMLDKVISQSQFLLLGEYHGSARLGEFTEALFPVLQQSSFTYFAIETGPAAAEILTGLSQKPLLTEHRLDSFYSKYYLAECDDIPVPFFEGKEDARQGLDDFIEFIQLAKPKTLSRLHAVLAC